VGALRTGAQCLATRARVVPRGARADGWAPPSCRNSDGDKRRDTCKDGFACRVFGGITQCTPALRAGEDCTYDTDCAPGADCDSVCVEAVGVGDACDGSLKWWVGPGGERRAAGAPFGQGTLTMVCVHTPAGCVVWQRGEGVL
jgi:hypothetical protein